MTSVRIGRYVVFSVAVGLAISGLVLAAQNQAPPVTVDFLVLAENGRPVTDVTAGEVTVEVDGRARTLDSLRLVEFAEPAADAGGMALPDPFSTNVVDENVRTVMIMFNDWSILAGQEGGVRAALKAFVGTLGANTRVGLMNTPQGTIRVEPTTDRQAVTAALDQIAGRAAPMQTPEDFTCRTSEALGELSGLFGSMSGAGAPTAILYVSAGLAPASTASARIGDETSGTGCEMRPEAYQSITPLAAAARAQVYVLQPEGLSSPQPGNEGLENLAGVTGGDLFRIGSSGDTALSRIAAETSAYYVATFQVASNERNGQAHRLAVNVSRPGVTTRSYSTVILGAPGGRGNDERSTTSPRDMLATEEVFRDLPLKATAVTSRFQPGETKLKVIVLAEPLDREAEINAVSVALIADNTVKAQWTAQAEELSNYPIVAALTADPGQYRLRVAATDTSGRSGAVDYDLNVVLHPADNLHLSDIAFLAPTAAGAAPTLEFRDEENAIAYFELYGQPQPDLFATIDVAKTIDGPELFGVQLQAAPSNEMFMITGDLAIGALEPGDYVVRVTVGRSPQAKLYRTLRKVQ